jgi:GTP-binding protein
MQTLPTLVIVGRPNVGKSTLFNVLTQSRDALVADQPGLTRDRQFGRGHFAQQSYLVVDTGGLGETKNAIVERITQQVLLAIQDADSILFLVDGRGGLTAADESITEQLRPLEIPIHLVINKAEGLEKNLVSAEFYQLGLESIHVISAAHRQGIQTLLETVLADFSPSSEEQPTDELQESIKVAIIGRPNVGKSTLVNQMLGYERMITFDQPGTTRDSIAIPFVRAGQQYTLIDTAGVRRRAKIFETIEKFSVIKTFQAIENSNVVVMLLDASEGITDQDTNLLGQVLDSGKALVIAVNKWDSLTTEHRQQVRYHLDRKLHFINFAKTHFISALHGSEVGSLFNSIKTAWQSAFYRINTGQLNELLQQILEAHPPPLIRGRRIKLRYAHQGGHNPPLFIIHGNQVEQIPNTYKRYLCNTFREMLHLEGTTVQLIFKQGENPYGDRKNNLTPRQRRKRQRLIRYVKKSS